MTTAAPSNLWCRTALWRAAFAFIALSSTATVSEARDQTRIGSWEFAEGDITPKSGVYFVTSSIGKDAEGTFSLIDFSCGQENYTLHLFPPPDARTGRNDLPDGIWTVQVSINNSPPSILSGRSDGGMIFATVPKQIVVALASIKSRSPSPDVLTAMIEKVDGGRIQRAVNYPAARFRAALNILAEACHAGD